ncbi:hypothetical protein K5E_22080 [Enterococcus thailandicus]|nr:hypothetical protein K4E_00530 [Enterococcus thailandicus]GMC10069.1 hypothetical protein K5E_22080 [Enterococcus thailandicus]
MVIKIQSRGNGVTFKCVWELYQCSFFEKELIILDPKLEGKLLW